MITQGWDCGAPEAPVCAGWPTQPFASVTYVAGRCIHHGCTQAEARNAIRAERPLPSDEQIAKYLAHVPSSYSFWKGIVPGLLARTQAADAEVARLRARVAEMERESKEDALERLADAARRER